MVAQITHGWGVLWRSENRLEGKKEYLIGNLLVFSTRQQARDYITEHYGYIRKRPDLRNEPHGWKMPIAVKVRAEVRVSD